ncbi:porin family protein [bacterium]|nr:porin family protein [bacterium]
MKKIVGLLLFLFCFAPSKAQISDDFYYGVGANLTLPQVGSNQTRFSALPGYGFGLNFGLRLDDSPWNLSSRIQYNRIFYYSEIPTVNVSVGSFELMLGFQYDVVPVKGLDLFAHVGPSYNNVTEAIISKTGLVYPGQVKGLDNIIDVGFEIGAGIQVAPGLKLNTSYSIQTLSRLELEYIDARPNIVKFGLYYTIGGSGTLNDERAQMEESLSKLQSDTLYVVNKACAETMTNDVLAELFSKYYRFSAFKVINVEEVDRYKSARPTLYFAYVGRYYAGMGEPESEGIFLLDHTFTLTEFPYPVFTAYNIGLSEDCFSEPDLSARVIQKFNNRLFTRS